MERGNSSPRLKPPNILEFREIPSSAGNQKGLSSVSAPSPELQDIRDLTLTPLRDSISSTDPQKSRKRKIPQPKKRKESVTVEFPPEHKQMTSPDRSIPCENVSRTLKLSRTLGVGLTSNEKAFANYSLEQLREISQQLWFPIETDLPGLDSNCSNGSLITTESNSWFSTRVLEVRNPNYAKTCFPLSTSFPVEQTELGDIGKGKKKRKVKRKMPKKVEKARIRFVKACEFPIVKCIDGKTQARICGRFFEEEDEKTCRKHVDMKFPEFDQYWPFTCQAIIKKQGTGIEEGQSRKGFACGEFCQENEQYCRVHQKSARKPKNPLIRCIKVRARPNKEQRQILEKWFGDKRKTYNLMVEERLEEQLDCKVFLKEKHEMEGKFKKEHVTDCLEFLKATPKDVRAAAIEEYFTGVINAWNRYEDRKKSEQWKRENLKKHKAKVINPPIMKFQRKYDQQCISLFSASTSAVTLPRDSEDELRLKYPRQGIRLYPRTFQDPIILDRRSRRNKTLQEILKLNIQYDYKLLKTKTGKYYFCLPYAATVKPTTATKQAACDGGVRTFQTVYSPQGSLEEYGNGANETIRLYQTQIRNLRMAYFKSKSLRCERIRQYRFLLQEKLKNMVHDLHSKTANSLCNKYKTIILPYYGIASMMKSNKVTSATKRENLALSHGLFRNRLISKAEIRACDLLIPPNEFKTTMACGLCFVENRNVGGSKIFICSNCGLIAGRDTNSGRDIFIRQLTY